MRRQFYFEIFAASLSASLLEIAYTRVFSFKLHYSFAYLVISIGLIGLGAGGVLLVASRRLAQKEPDQLIPGACLLGGAAVLVGYWAAARLQLDASALGAEPVEIIELFAVCALVAAPFVAVGLVVSVTLSTRVERAGSLYAVSLAGAALGCTLSIFLIEAFDPPRVVMLAGAILAAAAFPLAARRRPMLAAGSALAVLLLLSGTVLRWLPDPAVDRGKGFEEYRRQGLVRTSQWSSVSRLDVTEVPSEGGDLFWLFHDGLPRSAMRRFPSRVFENHEQSSRKLPFLLLPRPAPRVLVVGSGGGREVVAALYFGASHVTAVELDPATLSVLTDSYAEVTGRLHHDPRVTFVLGDARWFLEQTSESFDLIWMVSPDYYRATDASASGALVLAENYHYTVEMIEQVFRRLAPGGLFCAQFGESDYGRQANRTTRFLATAKQYHYEARIPDFKWRTLVATSEELPPLVESTVLLSRSAYTRDQIETFLLQVGFRTPRGVARYVPNRPPDDTAINQVVYVPYDLIADWYRVQPDRLGPVRDDSPFFWHFNSFFEAFGARHGKSEPVDFEDGVGERVLIGLLVLVVALGALLSITPRFGMRETWRKIPHKAHASAYFAALGVGFMFVEVSLMQRLTLLLGYPTRSLSVTLFGILLSSGLGSALSTRYARSPYRALGVLLAALFVLLGVWHLAAPRAVEVFLGAALAVRVLVALLLIIPVGVCLGGFLPIGLAIVAAASPHPREFVAWAWAVNAFATVVGSILSAMFAMEAGFKFLMVAAPVIYVAGSLALLRIGDGQDKSAAEN